MMAEINCLHGTTVAEIFASGIDNLDQIDAVAVSVLWKGGRVVAGCSNTTNDRLALMVLTLDEHQRQAFRQEQVGKSWPGTCPNFRASECSEKI